MLGAVSFYHLQQSQVVNNPVWIARWYLCADKGIFRTVDPEIAVKALDATNEKIIFETTSHFNRDTVTEMYKKVEHLFLEGLLKPEVQND
ncbi:MAG: hypothetical protein GY774_00570 [Planctomycetes bacterium]|nr:hypothetical protein [Planctomycetota bacterium]